MRFEKELHCARACTKHLLTEGIETPHFSEKHASRFEMPICETVGGRHLRPEIIHEHLVVQVVTGARATPCCREQCGQSIKHCAAFRIMPPIEMSLPRSAAGLLLLPLLLPLLLLLPPPMHNVLAWPRSVTFKAVAFSIVVPTVERWQRGLCSAAHIQKKNRQQIASIFLLLPVPRRSFREWRHCRRVSPLSRCVKHIQCRRGAHCVPIDSERKLQPLCCYYTAIYRGLLSLQKRLCSYGEKILLCSGRQEPEVTQIIQNGVPNFFVCWRPTLCWCMTY